MRLEFPLEELIKTELDKRLDEYEADGNPGRPVDEVIQEIKSKILSTKKYRPTIRG